MTPGAPIWYCQRDLRGGLFKYPGTVAKIDRRGVGVYVIKGVGKHHNAELVWLPEIEPDSDQRKEWLEERSA